jgi:exodeoxyribonuclease VII large subunit
MDPLTVTELNSDIKTTLTKYYGKPVIVTGEISNFKVSQGTAFFMLKDNESKIDGIIFNYTGNNIANGKQVKVTGSVLVTVKSGTFRISAKQIELIGIGNLHQAYVELKERYEKLGYFDDSRKKPLKSIINTIGVITSQDGAALHDFIYALTKNNYLGKVYVKHSIVQGKDCPNSVSNSLQELDKMNLDVIVITRGGGSFEDLFGFSDSKIIETLYNMNTVTVSAIGHQIDYMLCDFIADVRAPTPSLAGELLSCKNENIFSLDEVTELEYMLSDKIINKIKSYDNELKIIENSISPVCKIMDGILCDLDKLCNHINFKIQNKILSYSTELNDIIIPPCSSSVMLDKNKNIINCIDQFDNIKNKHEITIKFAKGYVTFNVSNIKVYK